MSSVPDASKKLIAQVATDAGLKHEPTRKRDNKRRGDSRGYRRGALRLSPRKPRPALPPQPDQHQQEDLQ